MRSQAGKRQSLRLQQQQQQQQQLLLLLLLYLPRHRPAPEKTSLRSAATCSANLTRAGSAKARSRRLPDRPRSRVRSHPRPQNTGVLAYAARRGVRSLPGSQNQTLSGPSTTRNQNQDRGITIYLEATSFRRCVPGAEATFVAHGSQDGTPPLPNR